MARKKSITKRRRLLFLEKLKGSGSVTKAAIAGEIGRSSWYDLAERDADFKELWDDSEAEFADNLEAEAINRAVFGVVVEKPYLNVEVDGKRSTRFNAITIKSDRLLELCLKARHVSYKPVLTLEQTSPDGSMTPRPADGNTDNLTDEELETLVILQRKLHATSDGRP